MVLLDNGGCSGVQRADGIAERWGSGGSMSKRILVPFAGEGAGVGELAWGQREIWLAMQRQRSWLPIGFTRPLPAGTTVEDVASDLHFALCRHPSMRTRVRLAADGHPMQEVAAAGEVELEVIEAGGADPAQLGATVQERYMATDHDHVTEWPVRVAVICSGGVPTHHVMVACHLVSDGLGALVLQREWAARAGAAPTLSTATDPLAQARWQQSPAGRRQSESAMRYWERLLRGIAPQRYASGGDERQPRHWRALYRSPAMNVATRAVAARNRLDSSYVHLAAYCVAAARVTGVNPVVVQVVVGNRFRPGLADTVSPVNQTGLCVIDVADATFDEVVARAWRKTMGTYKHAYYDPVELVELVDRVSRERGAEVDIGCFFNPRRFLLTEPPPAPEPTPGALRAALAGSELTWCAPGDLPAERLFLSLDDLADSVHLELRVDTRYFPPAGMEQVLRGMEAVLVAAAFDPDARTGVGRAAAHV
jgi:Condensation domain